MKRLTSAKTLSQAELGPKYIKHYDMLRAFALIAVSFYHFLPNTVPGGFLGVVLFFVFAGFLTARSMLMDWDSGRSFNLRDYYIRRFLKLYPPLLLFLVLSLLYAYIFLPGRFLLHRNAVPSVLFGYNNYYQLARNLSYFDMHGRFDAFVHLWALALEFQFYLIFPLFCVLVKERFRLKIEDLGRLLLILAFASYLYSAVRFRSGVDPTPIYYSSLARLYQFLLPAGVVFLFGRRRLPVLRDIVRGVLQLILTVYLVSSVFFYRYDHPLLYSIGLPVYTAAALLFLFLGRMDHAPIFMKTELWSKIAERSYSLYLWQYGTMIFVTAHYASTKASFARMFFIAIIVWLLFSEFSYLLIQGGWRKRQAERRSRMVQAIRSAGLSSGEHAENEKLKRRRRRAETAVSLLGLLGGLLLLQILPVPEPSAQEVFDEAKLAQAAAEAERISASQAALASTTESSQEASEGRNETPTTTASPSTPAALGGPGTVPEDPLTGPFTEAQLAWLAELKVTLVGDSVSVAATPAMMEYLPQLNVKAEVSRQMWDAPGILDALSQEGTLGDVVVIALGTNGSYDTSWLYKISSAAADRPLVFINSVMPNTWENQVNQALAEFVHEKEHCSLVDWYYHAKERPELFYDDFTHPAPEGQKAYANLLMWKLLEIGKQVVS